VGTILRSGTIRLPVRVFSIGVSLGAAIRVLCGTTVSGSVIGRSAVRVFSIGIPLGTAIRVLRCAVTPILIRKHIIT
jgi:hypothetical protein